MKVKEIRTLPEDEIQAEIEKAHAKLFKIRFQGKGENVENPGSVGSLRRHVARLKTVLRERQLSGDRTATAGRGAAAAGSGGAGSAEPTAGGEA